MIVVRRARAALVGAITTALVLSLLAGCAPAEPVPQDETPGVSEPTAPPETDGTNEIPATDTERALVESKCSQCHSLDQVWAAQKDASGWESTVRRMEANGLQLTDEERQRVIDYLASR